MTQENESGSNASPDREGLDDLQELVAMAFIKDYPGIPHQTRRSLLNEYGNLSTRKDTVKRAQAIVEELLKREFDVHGVTEDSEYSFIYAPYDVVTGQRLHIPAIWVMVSRPLPQGSEKMDKIFFPNENAFNRFDREVPRGHWPTALGVSRPFHPDSRT